MRQRGDAGFTLVEVIVSMLLSVIMVGATVAVAIGAKRSGGLADRKMAAGQGCRQLSAQLGAFVTTYWDYSAKDWIDTGMGEIAGPAGGNPGAASWQWKTAGVADTCPNGAAPCYALSAGQHQLSNYLPAWFEAAPYQARISYTVDDSMVVGTANQGLRNMTAPHVTISVAWTEP